MTHWATPVVLASANAVANHALGPIVIPDCAFIDSLARLAARLAPTITVYSRRIVSHVAAFGADADRRQFGGQGRLLLARAIHQFL